MGSTRLAKGSLRSASAAHLRYVSDAKPGIARVRRGAHFRYVDEKGNAVRDEATLARIRSLVIPPAWTHVWICKSPTGHIQATGRDARGRKQYRYHPRWREVRDGAKYGRIVAFASALPRLRERVEADLRRDGLPKEKVVAAVVRLLEVTLIRVGNPEYTRDNGSFGLTTMRDQHVTFRGTKVRFRFRGKAGVARDVELQNPRLARIVRKCRDIPGEELFQYQDGKAHRSITSSDVNAYVKRATGKAFTAKDFRTWAGTVLAAWALHELEEFDSKTQAKRNVVEAVKRVSERLGNTPAVCRRCYVHPAVLDAYLDGDLVETLRHRAESVLRTEMRELTVEEAAVVALLQQRLRRERAGRPKIGQARPGNGYASVRAAA